MKYIIKYAGLVLLLIAIGAGYVLYTDLVRPMNVPTKGLLYEYPKGTSVKTLSRDLAQRGIIPSGFAFLWYARLSGNAPHLHAGEYLLTPNLTPKTLLEKIRKGDIYMHALRIPEGGTMHDVIQLLTADPAIKHTMAFEGNWFVDVSSAHALGEGLLLPETYFFPKNETDLSIIKRANRDMMAYAQKAFDARDLSVPYVDVYQALIVASILEKEASIPEERTKIARVIINRLAKNMPLQMDPTVIYGMGTSYDGKLRKADLTQPGPYNTYVNGGLPPTPICFPSKNAILSAMHPAVGDFLYFVSEGDGSHYFSSTLKEHNEAVLKYVIHPQKKDIGQ